MKTGFKRLVTLIGTSLIVAGMVGCATRNQPASTPVATDSAEAATMTEINAAARLSNDNARTHALIQIAERPGLSASAQVHLINTAYRNLKLDNNKTAVMARMIERPDFSDSTKQAIVSQLGELNFDFNRQYLLQQINERTRRQQAARSTAVNAPVTNTPSGPRTNTAIVPVPRTGSATNRQSQVLQRAKDNPGPCDIAFIGDSITQGWEGNGKNVWTNYYGSRKCLNFGVGGDRTQHVLWRFENGQLEGLKPKVAVLMIGTNNSNRDDNTEADILAGVQSIVKQIRERLPETKIILLGIFPRAQAFSTQRGKILQVNQALAKLDDGKTVFYIDFGSQLIESDGSISKVVMPDYLHLSEQGYEIWAKAIEPKLRELLAQ